VVRRLREVGVMKGLVHVWREGEPDLEELRLILMGAPDYDEVPFAYQVSPREPVVHGNGGPTVAVLDCGVKYGIIRELLNRGFRVIRYPCTSRPHELLEEAQGVVLSNGPGNPDVLEDVVTNVNQLMEYRVPILGICLGHQLVGLASGARVIKLKYGHRGANKPVKDLETSRCYVTTQNHGYALDPESIKGTGFRLWFVNPDDGTVEGLIHEKDPVLTVQFHPEASPGPWDTTWIFDKFLKLIQ
jgi:carbamoyl-phosphate synthase small subunit